MRLHAGDPDLSGSHLIEGGVNFVVESANACAVELCLFDNNGHETDRLSMTERQGDRWHGFLPGVSAGLQYGYRMYGPFNPERGLFYEPARLLVDPWARQLSGHYQQHPGHFPGIQLDTAGFTPKSVVQKIAPKFSTRKPLTTAPLIYEAHVRGFTRLHQEIPAQLRGTYAALGHPVVIRHLKSLGVNALELLPIQFHIDEPHLVKRGLTNYWGYSPIGTMALHHAYAANPLDPVGELASSISALHAAGIEVILDVVFNHTAEGGVDGPITSLRGFDPAVWYLHLPDEQHLGIGRLADFTGCGNTLNVANPRVVDWIMATLRFYCEALDVDGFRFDLATSLGRQGETFDPTTHLLHRLATDPVIGECRLIAEPWDIGPRGYQLGGFGAPWYEWNDRFRDGVRSFWKGDPGAQAELGRRLHGSSDLFETSGRTPAASINFITAHDGFCLEDLVSYKEKHNLANGEENRDGTAHNLSDNLGEEGTTSNLDITHARQRRKRALLATMMLAEGTPMLLAGDELGHSQHGNNNAYCQDNELTWLNWSRDQNLVPLISNLASLRAERAESWSQAFVHTTFEHADRAERSPSVAWYAANGSHMTAEDWHREDCPFAHLRADQLRLELCLFNRTENTREFQLPRELTHLNWRCRFDSATVDGNPRHPLTALIPLNNHSITMESQSVIVLDCLSQGNGSPHEDH